MKKWLQLLVLCVVVAVVWGECSLVQAQTGDLKPKLATSIGEIAGTWFTKDCYFYPGCYLRIDKDGTGRQARAPDKLDNEPYARTIHLSLRERKWPSRRSRFRQIYPPPESYAERRSDDIKCNCSKMATSESCS